MGGEKKTEIVANDLIISIWGKRGGVVRMNRYVYSIRCKPNGKRYIGETCLPRDRFKCHIYALRVGHHYNKDLQNDFRKYGENNFEIEILEKTDDYSPTSRAAEQRWIRRTKAFNPSYGYNNDKKSKIARGEDPSPWVHNNVRKKKNA